MLMNEGSGLQFPVNRPLGDESNPCYSETELIRAAKEGNQKAFGDLCQRYTTQILRILLRITRNKEDAEDAAQEGLLNAYLHLAQFDGRSRFSTWLIRISINQALMGLRKNRLQRTLSLENDQGFVLRGIPINIPDFTFAPDLVFAKRERTAVLRQAVSKIPLSLRKTIELRVLREYTTKETADALGISVGATKSRMFHAKNQLHKQVMQNWNPPGVPKKNYLAAQKA